MGSINWNAYIKAAEDAGESMDEFTPIPADKYNAKVLEAKATQSKSSGADMIAVTWVIDGGAHSGRRLWSYLSLSEKAVPITIKNLTTLGARTLMESGASLEQVAAAIIGAPALLTVKVGEYNGKPKNEVGSIAARKDVDIASAAPSFGATPAGLPI